jgi:transposase-like protein
MNENERKCTIGENRLNEQQRAAIEMLVLGKAIGEISKALEIAPCTLYRWRQEAAFGDELAQRRAEFWAGAGDRLKDLIHPSLEVMAEHLADRYDRARFRAASAVLRLAGNRRVFESGAE